MTGDGLFADDYISNGHAGPVRVLSFWQRQKLLHRLKSKHLQPPHRWYKGLALSNQTVRDVAFLPAITSRVAQLIGGDFELWGCNLIRRKPGQQHPWHCDEESHANQGTFVSVWLGLQNVSAASSPIFIAGSHRLDKSVQQVRAELGLHRDTTEDDAILNAARQYDPGCSITSPAASNGDAIFFNGRIWHATRNTHAFGTRMALLLQYCAAGDIVRIPTDSHLDWPFELGPQRALSLKPEPAVHP